MSTPTSPTATLPTRSSTIRSTTTETATRRTSVSDDEAIPDSDSSEVCFRWKWKDTRELTNY